jgi:hypothetical protein
LLLPVIAILHVRHQAVRESGAVLGTTAGTAAITVGLAAMANPDLIVAALFIRGIWWWTIGKLWSETGVVPRWLGLPTMALAVLAIAAALGSGVIGVPIATLAMSERALLGLWLLALSFAVWRTR